MAAKPASAAGKASPARRAPLASAVKPRDMPGNGTEDLPKVPSEPPPTTNTNSRLTIAAVIIIVAVTSFIGVTLVMVV